MNTCIPTAVAAAFICTMAQADTAILHRWDFNGDGMDSIGNADALSNPNAVFNQDNDSNALGLGGYASFDAISPGSADDIIVANTPPIDLGTRDFSISLWLRRTGDDGVLGAFIADARVGPFDPIVRPGGTGIGVGFSRTTETMPSAFAFNIATESAAVVVETDDPFIDGRGFMHYAITVERGAADGIKIYVDGKLATAGDATSIGGDAGGITLPGIVFGGSDAGDSASPSFGLNGDLALFTIYDGVLTPTEITELAVPVPATTIGFMIGFAAAVRRQRVRVGT